MTTIYDGIISRPFPGDGSGDVHGNDGGFKVFTGASVGSSHAAHKHGASWLAQVVGAKAWWLAPPATPRGLFPRRPYCSACRLLAASASAPASAVDGSDPLDSSIQFCVQQPGEVIWFPDKWLHATCSLDKVSLAVGMQTGHPPIPNLRVPAPAPVPVPPRGVARNRRGRVSPDGLKMFGGDVGAYYDSLTKEEDVKRDPNKLETLAVHRKLGSTKSTAKTFRVIDEALMEAFAGTPLRAARTVLDAGCGLAAGLLFFEYERPSWDLVGMTLSGGQQHYISSIESTTFQKHRFKSLLQSYDDLDTDSATNEPLPKFDAIYTLEVRANVWCAVHSCQGTAFVGILIAV